MTCHIALAGLGGTAMFSDSQGSTATAEMHGFQKQVHGRDFLLGGSGHGGVLHELLGAVSRANVTSAELEAFLKNYLSENVQSAGQAAVQLLVVTPDAAAKNIQLFTPGIFKGFSSRAMFNSIGSGSEFVFSAQRRDRIVGLEVANGTLADVIIAAEDYAQAANECLTVDDRFTVGMLVNGSAYMMGDAAIAPTHAPNEVIESWPEVARRYDEIINMVRMIRGEMRNAQRSFSLGIIYNAEREKFDALSRTSEANIIMNRAVLEQKLDEYCVWYDGLLKRSPK